jgi:hypothetical protein
MADKSELTVCIIGVAGFIGSHMLEKIIRERSWHVIGIDMVAPTKIEQLLGAEKKWAARFEFHQVFAASPHRTRARLCRSGRRLAQMDIVTSGKELKACIARSDTVRRAPSPMPAAHRCVRPSARWVDIARVGRLPTGLHRRRRRR